MHEMIEMEVNGKLGCCTGSDVSKRRRVLESADSPQHGATNNTEVTISFQDGLWPEWMLMEVLCRLPIKMVIRCKSVSKQWLSLISDPSFARLFNITSRGWEASAFSGSVWRRPPWVFIYNQMSAEGCGMTLLLEENLMDIISKVRRGGMYVIQAIHDGLVLYKWRDVPKGIDELYICNPMTNQWFPLPRPPKYILHTSVSYGFIARVEAGILTSYRVVLVRYQPRKLFIEFVVFCSESGKWVAYTVHSTRAVQVSYTKKTVFLNGKLHWNDCELGLIAYDPYTSPDEMRLIDFPKDHYKPGSYIANYSSCGVHQGLLKYFELIDPRGFPQLKIWVLEDYDMGGWCLQHMVAFEDIKVRGRLCYLPKTADLVCFDPYDAEIVFAVLQGLGLVRHADEGGDNAGPSS